MTEQENAQFEADLDVEIEDMRIEYHFDNFLKNIHGVHDLGNVCNDCMGFSLLAVQKHIQDRLDAMEEGEEDPTALQN